MRPALAAVIRAVRGSMGITQEGLTHAASRTYLSKIENAESSPSLEKFVNLAESLNLNPIALMTMVLATRDNCSSSSLLAQATEQVRELEERVSPSDIAAHLAGVDVVKRPAARPTDLGKLKSVLQCKEAGLSQAETARRLSLSRSTVSFLWKRVLPSEQ